MVGLAWLNGWGFQWLTVISSIGNRYGTGMESVGMIWRRDRSVNPSEGAREGRATRAFATAAELAGARLQTEASECIPLYATCRLYPCEGRAVRVEMVNSRLASFSPEAR